MVSLSMTLIDPWPGFQGCCIIAIKYLKNLARYSHSYYEQ